VHGPKSSRITPARPARELPGCAESIAAFPETVPKLCETVILRRCGHWMTREQPEQTNEALLRFLKRF
jgi:pimeloyl-ACP methyl ester carboxylesterase